MKRSISLLLAVLLLLSAVPFVSAFDDITDFRQSAAAESLASLGIVDSVSKFNPHDNLTRAQFCKIAVLSAGFEETSLYSGYTIYPDVRANTWYAPYVNAAVRKYAIIQGDENGLFNPESSITYGEAVTIILRMLGYTTADIGIMWPLDYVNKAQALGLSDGIGNLSPNAAITRGQAAILVCNMLLCQTKEGTLFASQGFSTGSDQSILLSLSSTNPTLSQNQAELYIDGASKIYASSANISPVLCGLKGIPVFASQTQSRLEGFIADIGSAEEETVTDISSESITVSGGRIDVPRDTLTFAGGSAGSYITHWFDIKKGDKITVYFDESGLPDLISAHSRAIGLSSSFVYGIDSDSLPSGASYVKNGIAISSSDVQKYDVLSYSPSNNTYYVSSDRVTLLYQSGSPVYANPSVIKAGNREFSVSEHAASYFDQSGIKLGGKITLLFDYNGSLAAVMPTSRVTGDALGVLTSLSDSTCKVELLCGLTLEGTPSLSGYGKFYYNGQSISSVYKLSGQLVSVSQNSDGLFVFSSEEYSGNNYGDLDISLKTLGKLKLSADLRVFECSEAGMSLHEIALSDIKSGVTSKEKILHVGRNSSGGVNLLVLKDVTGDRYLYGMAKVSSEKVSAGESLSGENMRTQYTITLKTSDNMYTYTTFYKPEISSYLNAWQPAAVSSDLVGESAKQYNFASPAFALSSSGSVKRSDFDAYRGVKIKGQYVEIDEGVVIYNTSTNTFISSLSEARANFTDFTVYLDRSASEGGTVRVITVK